MRQKTFIVHYNPSSIYITSWLLTSLISQFAQFVFTFRVFTRRLPSKKVFFKFLFMEDGWPVFCTRALYLCEPTYYLQKKHGSLKTYNLNCIVINSFTGRKLNKRNLKYTSIGMEERILKHVLKAVNLNFDIDEYRATTVKQICDNHCINK